MTIETIARVIVALWMGLILHQMEGMGEQPQPLFYIQFVLPFAPVLWLVKFLLARAYAARFEQVVFPRMEH